MNGRFYHHFGDLEHWECGCGQPNTFERRVCLACGDEQPVGVKSTKGRLGGK